MKIENNYLIGENIEKIILSFLLKSSKLRENILLKIKEEDFQNEKNKFIFNEIKELVWTNKNSLDFNILANKLSLEGNLKKVGGLIYLTEILDLEQKEVLVDIYIQALIKRSTKKKLELELIEIQKSSKKYSNYDELFSNLRKKLNDIEDFFNRNFNKFVSLENVTRKFFEDEQNLKESANKKGFMTGYKKLDEKLIGFQNGDLIILAARPSMGKTTLAINMMLSNKQNIDNEEGDIIFFSLETSPEQLAKKIIRLKTDFFSLPVSERNYMEKEKFLKFLNKKRIFIDNSSSINVSEISFKLREWKRKTKKILLVVIDYLQLLNSIKKQNYFYNNRNLEVSVWTKRLKEIAREINVPILCLSQLSRSVEKREDKHPLLSDLRDSGSIEQDADVVMFLFREEYYKKASSDFYESKIEPHEAEIIIAKHRNGPIGTVKLLFDPEKQTFFSLVDD